jgi:hypothetical protein
MKKGRRGKRRKKKKRKKRLVTMHIYCRYKSTTVERPYTTAITLIIQQPPGTKDLIKLVDLLWCAQMFFITNCP